MPPSTDNLVTERARRNDKQAIEALLRQHDLPLDDFEAHLGTAVVARLGERIVGSAALEWYADGALLRSVAVAPDLQGLGVGRKVVDSALQLASELKAPAIYLLTTTAGTYFPSFGFEEITRADVPESVRQSVEFKSACPSSATVMRLITPAV